MCFVGQAIAIVVGRNAAHSGRCGGSRRRRLRAVACRGRLPRSGQVRCAARACRFPRQYCGAPSRRIRRGGNRLRRCGACVRGALSPASRWLPRDGMPRCHRRGTVPHHDGLTIISATQCPYLVRRNVGRLSGPRRRSGESRRTRCRRRIRGPRQASYAEEIVVPLAAAALGRPVKWIEDPARAFRNDPTRSATRNGRLRRRSTRTASCSASGDGSFTTTGRSCPTGCCCR